MIYRVIFVFILFTAAAYCFMWLAVYANLITQDRVKGFFKHLGLLLISLIIGAIGLGIFSSIDNL